MERKRSPAEVLSIPPKKLEELQRFSNQAVVNEGAIKIAERLIDSSVYCRADQSLHHQLSGNISLDLLRKAYPILGFCLLLWAEKNQIKEIEGPHLLEAFASDFHHQRSIARMKNIIAPKYGLETLLSQRQFFLFDLAVGGELGLTPKRILYYPSKEEPYLVFELRRGEITPQNEGDLAVIHFGQVIAPANQALVDKLQQIHQSETMVNQLFEKARQDNLRVPHLEMVVSGVK